MSCDAFHDSDAGHVQWWQAVFKPHEIKGLFAIWSSAFEHDPRAYISEGSAGKSGHIAFNAKFQMPATSSCQINVQYDQISDGFWKLDRNRQGAFAKDRSGDFWILRQWYDTEGSRKRILSPRSLKPLTMMRPFVHLEPHNDAAAPARAYFPVARLRIGAGGARSATEIVEETLNALAEYLRVLPLLPT